VIRSIRRAAVLAAVGAITGALCLIAGYATRAHLVIEMDRELPRRIVSGVHPPERAGDLTFAWTSQRADFRLRGLNRGSPWTCVVVARGARGNPAAQPQVDVAIDGITLKRAPATQDFQPIEVTAPSRPQPGLILSVTSSATLVPPSDGRELGLQLDRVACRPAAGGWTLPPSNALQSAAMAGAAWGAVLAVCLPLPAALVGLLLLAVGQSLPFATGTAPYGLYDETALRLALWLAAFALAAVKLLEWRTGPSLSVAARFVVVLSAGVLYLKLLALLHPGKALIDIVFHAHRLQAVLGGGYYFTQIMPSGVAFPYAIGLYVMAAPWSSLTRDYAMLLRIVVSTTEAIAGLLLYAAIARHWGDRLAGALAVLLFHAVPLPYGLIGNANMTNAFGQAAALIAVTAAAAWSLHWRSFLLMAGLFALVSLAFLSHISTAAHLGVTLLALALLCRWLGDQESRASAWPILAVTLVAALGSWVIYYGHFTEVYATALQKMRATPQVVAAPRASGDATRSSAQGAGSPVRPPSSLLTRSSNALGLTTVAIGWPIGALAVAGMWRLWQSRARDRLSMLIAAWAATYLVFLAVGIVPRVEAPFERYAAEFVGRVVFATYPAAVLLGALAAAWGWRAGPVWRLASLVCVLSALSIGVHHWRAWFE
jgi:hypothetical protein